MFERLDEAEKSKMHANKFDEALHRNFRQLDTPPPCHGEAQEVTVHADRGRMLTLRTEDGTKGQLEQVLQKDRLHVEHPIRIRMYEGGQQVGYANLTLEVEKTIDNQTGHAGQIDNIRMRLADFNPHEEKRLPGIGALILERAEQLAHQGRARELYGIVENQEMKSLLNQQRHLFRPGAFGEEHYKTFYFK